LIARSIDLKQSLTPSIFLNKKIFSINQK
jgi:hypothetical protein